MTDDERNYEVFTEGGLVKSWTKGVPFDDNARAQVRNVASMPFIHKHVAIMPDVHWGCFDIVSKCRMFCGSAPVDGPYWGTPFAHSRRPSLVGSEGFTPIPLSCGIGVKQSAMGIPPNPDLGRTAVSPRG